MNKTLLLLNTIFFYSMLNAQLSNTGFETWENPLLHNTFNVSTTVAGATIYVCGNFDYNEAENWSSSNQLTQADDFGGVELVSESTIAHTGSKSVKIESKNTTITAHIGSCNSPITQDLDNVAPGLIVNGSFNLNEQELVDNLVGGAGLNALNPFNYPGTGQAINFIPKTLSGFYQYTGANGDSCLIVSGFKKNGVLTGYAIQRLGNANTWTSFSLEYTHLSCETPDTIITLITSSNLDIAINNGELAINSDYTGENGSVLYVDDLHIDTILLNEFPPLLVQDTDTILVNETSTVNVLLNDVFCDMGTYSPILINTGSNGTASIVANNVEYIPNSNFTGSELLSYYICNSMMLCDTTTVRIQVNPVAVCQANEDLRTVNSGSTDNFDPRANDVDCGTTVNLVSTTSVYGSAEVESNNTITYVPNASFVGLDTFDYYICSADNPSQCDTATVKITVTTAINEIDEQDLKIYPNPTHRFLTIELDLTSDAKINLYNIVGEKVYSENFKLQTNVDLKTFSNGLYFVEIESDGKKSIRKIQVVK